jgi:choline kinase
MRRHPRRFITSPQDGKQVTDELVTVALLSAQAGHRMKSYGPIPLLPLGNKNLLDRQIASIRSVFKIFELIVCVGFGSEKVIKYIKEKYSDINIRVVENQVHHHSNCCESARLCLNNTTNGKVLICNGDLVLERSVLSNLEFNHSYMITENSPTRNLEVGLTTSNGGYVENICFGLDSVWSEIVFINGKDSVEALRRILSVPEYKTKFLFEGLNELGRTKHKLKSISNKNTPVIKIDNIKTYHEVRRNYEVSNTKLRK